MKIELNDKGMSGKNDLMRQASMFTMNGMPDPRLFATQENQKTYNTANKNFYAELSKSIRTIVDSISRRALREKNAH